MLSASSELRPNAWLFGRQLQCNVRCGALCQVTGGRATSVQDEERLLNPVDSFP